MINCLVVFDSNRIESLTLVDILCLQQTGFSASIVRFVIVISRYTVGPSRENISQGLAA